jgi:hypothetical protein
MDAAWHKYVMGHGMSLSAPFILSSDMPGRPLSDRHGQTLTKVH